jgi:biopolymer transport protein ExbB
MLRKISIWLLIACLVAGVGGLTFTALAQDEEAAEGDAPEMVVDGEAAADAGSDEDDGGLGFFKVVASGGFLGIVLWLALGASSVAGIALIFDSFITIRQKKIAPDLLVEEVRSAMEQGDVMKALKHCEDEPGPLANILSAGFANVQEGFEAIQDSVGVAADMESEKLMQRVTYLNVVGNLAPMLGLLGTVQGMIYAFATLATESAGAAQQAALAMNISQALFTTAAGLCIAVPAVGFFYYFKNRATKIILGMEALTLDLIKVLRNVEVVEE